MRLKAVRWSAWILASASAAAVAAPTDDRAAADRAKIVAGERAWGQAYVTGDVATAQRLLADDFIGVDTHGTSYDKASVIADIAAGPHSTSDIVDHLNVRLHGDFAVVRAEEHGVGPAPEYQPREAVFTDSWVRQDGHWRIVAAEDLNRGLKTPSIYSADEAAIRELRAASNRAIAAHDVAALAQFFANDALFVWSDGSTAVGKAAMKRAFAKDFANPATIAYVRSPVRVTVSASGTRAFEQGSWTGLKKCMRYGGDYSAQWAKSAAGWHIRGEIYVKLHCTGMQCTP